MIKCEFENGSQAKLRHVAADCIGIKEGKIILVKRSKDTENEPGKYCLPGGFVERMEKVEQAGKRELREETGYEGNSKELFWINDRVERSGTDRGTVVFTYIVDIGEEIEKHDDEVEEVKWFDLEDLPKSEEMAFDHLEIIERYKKWLKEKFKLPIVGD